MKIKIRPERADTFQMNGHLAGLRDDESARPADPGIAQRRDPGPTGPGNVEPTRYVRPVPAGPGRRYQQNDLGRAGRGYPPLGHAELEWHHDYEAGEARPGWQISQHIHAPAVATNPARV